ncbi:MAG: hypothetical protein GEV07_24020 [Streptosporangiales bacterium]|nr:hypothetical protein [Streptosporangiales bacterium]
MQDLHRELFKRSYDWAGGLRSREIGIGDNSGVPSAQLTARLEVLFGQLRRESELRRLTDGAQWADRAGYYWGELNRCHPFADGNGRSSRLFLHQLAKAAGHQADWQAVVEWHWHGKPIDGSAGGTQAVDEASKAAYRGDYEPMRGLLQYAVTGSGDRASAPRTDLDALDHSLRQELDAVTQAKLRGGPGTDGIRLLHESTEPAALLAALRDKYGQPKQGHGHGEPATARRSVLRLRRRAPGSRDDRSGPPPRSWSPTHPVNTADDVAAPTPNTTSPARHAGHYR